jgi:hypothetical protein
MKVWSGITVLSLTQFFIAEGLKLYGYLAFTTPRDQQCVYEYGN